MYFKMGSETEMTEGTKRSKVEKELKGVK